MDSGGGEDPAAWRIDIRGVGVHQPASCPERPARHGPRRGQPYHMEVQLRGVHHQEVCLVPLPHPVLAEARRTSDLQHVLQIRGGREEREREEPELPRPRGRLRHQPRVQAWEGEEQERAPVGAPRQDDPVQQRSRRSGMRHVPGRVLHRHRGERHEQGLRRVRGEQADLRDGHGEDCQDRAWVHDRTSEGARRGIWREAPARRAHHGLSTADPPTPWPTGTYPSSP